MSTTAVELQGLSQAGKPYMRLVRVRWDSKYFRSGLRTTPTPLLVPMLGSLYIQWGQDPLLLTQLLLYGDSLTPSIKSRSEGNSFLMYKPGMEWFPIALHLTQETPGLQIKMSHVMDYCTMWRKAELAVQRHLQLPQSYFHDDPRFRAAWAEGLTSYEMAPLSRRQRRRRGACMKRKWDLIADDPIDSMRSGESRDWIASEEELPEDSSMEAVREAEDEYELDGAKLYHDALAESVVDPRLAEGLIVGQQERVDTVWGVAHPTSEVVCRQDEEGGGEEQESGHRTHLEQSGRLMTGQPIHIETEWAMTRIGRLTTGQSRHIEIEWAMTSEGQPYLIRKGEEMTLGMPTDKPLGRITSRHREVLRSPFLSTMEAQCTFCRCGMYPPSITRCMRCGKHWMHTYCIPLELNGSHKSNFWCSGCRAVKACPSKEDEELCQKCDCLVVDHESSIRCTKCSGRWHVLCLAEAYPRTLGGLTPSLFRGSRGLMETWTCPGCTCTSVESSSSILETKHQPTITLPLDRSAGRIPVDLASPFGLRLSGDHLPMTCCWHREPLRRGSQTFRETKQLVMAIWGANTDHVAALESLLGEKDVHILALRTGDEMGSQLLQFVVFGQTKQKGPPVILLQGVQQALRLRGLGTWALQFLYRECGKSRELLAKGYIRQGYMDFLKTKGFIPRSGSVKLSSALDRYPTIGNYVCRRPAIQGAFIGPSLKSVVLTYNMSSPDAGGMWICPPRAGFTQPIGKNSCFAHALLQMILGVPQMVAFFATQDWPAGGTGALLARCLALLWMSEDDQEGPDGVELLRARVEGDFGQNHHQLHRGNRGKGK